MKFDAEFIPDIGTNDVYLWGEAPNFGRVRFSIDSVILVDHLGVRNPVHRENNLAHCKANRERVERACRRAFSRRLANCVSLVTIDTSLSRGAAIGALSIVCARHPRDGVADRPCNIESNFSMRRRPSLGSSQPTPKRD